MLKALKVAVHKYEQSLGEDKCSYMQTLKDIADFFLVNLSNPFIFDNAYLFVHSMVLIDTYSGCGNPTFYNNYLLPQLKKINIVLQEQGSLATKAVALLRRSTNKFYLYLNNKGYTPKVIESFEDVVRKIIEDHYYCEWPSSLRFMKYLLPLFWAAFQIETGGSKLEELLGAVDVYYGACKQVVDKATQPYQLQLVLSAGDMSNVNQLLAQGLPMRALMGIINDKTYAKNFFSNDNSFYRHCAEYEKLVPVLRQLNFLRVICESIKKCYIARASKNVNTTDGLQTDSKSAAGFLPPPAYAPSAAASAALLVAVAGASSSPIYSGSAAAAQPDNKNEMATLKESAQQLNLLLDGEGSQSLNLSAVQSKLEAMLVQVKNMKSSAATAGPTPSAPPALAPGGPTPS